MKVSEFVFIVALLVISCLLSFALMEAGGRMVAEMKAPHPSYEQVIEERNALLHAYMFPEPTQIEIVSYPTPVPQEEAIFITRPAEED